MKTLVQKYEKLTKSTILIEANNQEYEINFEPAHFKHLAGIHYLNDVKLLNVSATKLFNMCKSSKVNLSTLKRSDHFINNNIDLRIEALNNILELFLNSKYITGSEFRKMYKYSAIKSNVVIIFHIVNQESNSIFLHTKINTKTNVLTPVSLYSVPKSEVIDLRSINAVRLKPLYSWKAIYK